MAETISINQQYLTSAAGPLDLKLAPVNTPADLTSIKRSYRYVGMTVTVLNTDTTNIPCDYWLVGSTTNWQIKHEGYIDTYANLLAINAKYCRLGLEYIVINDENNASGMSKYWCTAIEDGVATWARKVYGNEVLASVEDTVDMLMNKKYGNVVYTTDTIYSYTDPETGELTWTAKEADIPSGTSYESYSDGLYAITQNSDGETSFEQVVTSENVKEITNQVSVDGDDAEKAN